MCKDKKRNYELRSKGCELRIKRGELKVKSFTEYAGDIACVSPCKLCYRRFKYIFSLVKNSRDAINRVSTFNNIASLPSLYVYVNYNYALFSTFTVTMLLYKLIYSFLFYSDKSFLLVARPSVFIKCRGLLTVF